MSYEPSFNDCVEFTLRQEGLLSNNPNDAGGLTKFGITAATWADYRKLAGTSVKLPVSVSQITVDQAIDVYHLVFWQEPGIAALPRELQGPAFDFQVNSGYQAIKLLQACLGVAQDAKLGPVTLAKMATMQSEQLRRLRNDYVAARLFFDLDLAQHNPKDVAFIEGWAKRIVKLFDFKY